MRRLPRGAGEREGAHRLGKCSWHSGGALQQGRGPILPGQHPGRRWSCTQRGHGLSGCTGTSASWSPYWLLASGKPRFPSSGASASCTPSRDGSKPSEAEPGAQLRGPLAVTRTPERPEPSWRGTSWCRRWRLPGAPGTAPDWGPTRPAAGTAVSRTSHSVPNGLEPKLQTRLPPRTRPGPRAVHRLLLEAGSGADPAEGPPAFHPTAAPRLHTGAPPASQHPPALQTTPAPPRPVQGPFLARCFRG
mmetsp:Transcript_13659/g.38824  ORF Transcript_13659/g.38824 Transcript_13659/m.38824 type:complete len:247 (+) Transcript_13659:229-969(+)